MNAIVDTKFPTSMIRRIIASSANLGIWVYTVHHSDPKARKENQQGVEYDGEIRHFAEGQKNVSD